MKPDGKPYCFYPWFHQKVNTDGSVVPCCAWRNDGSTFSGNDLLNSDMMADLRRRMVDHDPPSNCENCRRNESLGSRGVRDDSFWIADVLDLDVKSPPLLRSQEVDISNLCNLRCRMCDPSRSSRWIADARRLGMPDQGIMDSGWTLSDEDAANTRYLRFLGGEPMLHQDRILDALADRYDALIETMPRHRHVLTAISNCLRMEKPPDRTDRLRRFAAFDQRLEVSRRVPFGDVNPEI